MRKKKPKKAPEHEGRLSWLKHLGEIVLTAIVEKVIEALFDWFFMQ